MQKENLIDIIDTLIQTVDMLMKRVQVLEEHTAKKEIEKRKSKIWIRTLYLIGSLYSFAFFAKYVLVPFILWICQSV